MVSKDSSSAETRLRILDAARAEFAEKGYDGARVDAIAVRAGVNKALIYYYFRSKEVLLDELLQQFLNDRAKLRDTIDTSGDPAQLAIRIAQTDIGFLCERGDVLRVALMESLKNGGGQGNSFIDHWAEGLANNRAIYQQNGMSFRYTPRVVCALFFYHLMPMAAFATMGETVANKFGLDIHALRDEFLKLVGESLMSQYQSVFAASAKDPIPEVNLPQPKGGAHLAKDESVPGHLQTSDAEKQKLLAKHIVNGRLKKFPLKEKAVVVVLEYCSALFDVRKTYSEKEVNTLLATVAEDYVKVRRYLVEYGYLGRRSDGSAYWLRE